MVASVVLVSVVAPAVLILVAFVLVTSLVALLVLWERSGESR